MGKVCYISDINTLRQRQNGRHFADAIFRCIFVYEKFWILIKISLEFVPKGPIDNNSTLVQVMAWRQTGDKPLPEPMMTKFNDAYGSSVHEKIIGHVGHFRWQAPNAWWEIWQLWIEYIKPIGQMSDEPWKFFCNTLCHPASMS